MDVNEEIAAEAVETEARFNAWWAECQQYAKDVQAGIEAAGDDAAEYLRALGEWNAAVEAKRRRLTSI
jgi:hypothetical protein